MGVEISKHVLSTSNIISKIGNSIINTIVKVTMGETARMTLYRFTSLAMLSLILYKVS